MDNTNLHDKIDDYLDGLLSESERADMDAALAQDTALARDLELHRTEREALALLSEDGARADFLSWTTEVNRPETPKPAPVPWWRKPRWFPALALAVVGMALWFWLFRVPSEAPVPARPTSPEPAAPLPPAAPKLEKPAPKQPVAEAPKPPNPKPEALPAGEFDAATKDVFAAVTEAESLFSAPSDAASRTRSGGNEPDPESPFAKGVQVLKEAQSAADYRQAIELFAQVDSIKNKNLSLAASYLQGHALFRLKRYEEAANSFQRAFQPKSTMFYRDAKWKEALCLYAAFGAELRQKSVVLSACQSGTGLCGKYYDRLRESLRWTVNNYPGEAQKAAQLLERLGK